MKTLILISTILGLIPLILLGLSLYAWAMTNVILPLNYGIMLFFSFFSTCLYCFCNPQFYLFFNHSHFFKKG